MFPEMRRPARWLMGIAAAVCAVAMFSLPYHVPVAPVMSQSYATGFNNHLASALFLAACGCFCLATGGSRVPPKAEDRKLPLSFLGGALVLSILLPTVWRVRREHKPLGSESAYLLNRHIHLLHGARLYRDIEFIYGPLLLYPGVLLQKLTHVSALHAYMAVWVLYWALGTGMFWYLIAALEIPNARRWLLFLFLYLMALVPLRSEGVQYTPLRSYFAAFFAVLVAQYWLRTGSGRRTAVLMAVAIVLGFGISPEQGFGLGIGLSAYAVLLAFTSAKRFPALGAAAVVTVALIATGVAKSAGELRSTSGFAQGGQNFPLLPSPLNCFLLAIYVCALMVLYRAVRSRDWKSMAIPLGLCGLPMLSSALGRCDAGHLSGDTPLYVLGLFWIFGQRWALWVWAVPAAILVLPVGDVLSALQYAHLRKADSPATALQGAVAPAGQPI